MPITKNATGKFIPFLKLKYALSLLAILALIIVLLGWLSSAISKKAALDAVSAQGRALTESLISATDVILKSNKEITSLAVNNIADKMESVNAKKLANDITELEKLKVDLKADKLAIVQAGRLALISRESKSIAAEDAIPDTPQIQSWLDSLSLEPDAEFVFEFIDHKGVRSLWGYFPVSDNDGLFMIIPWDFGQHKNPQLGLYYLLNSVAQEAGIEYILLQNLDGIVFASKKIASMPKISEDNFLLNSLNFDTTSSRIISFQDRQVLETVKQFKSDDFDGLFRVGLSLIGYRQIVANITRQIWLVVLALAVIGLMALTAILGFQNYQIMNAGYQKSQIVMQNLLDSIPGPVVAIDQNLKITHINSSSTAIFGIPPNSLLKDDYPAIFPNDDLQLKKALFEHKNISFEESLGAARTRYLISSIPLFDAAGQPVGALSLSQDITDSKKAEESLEARRRLSELGALAASMAHEVRNPLNAIGMSVQRLKNEFQPSAKSDEYNNFMDTLRGEVGRLNDLIEKFLIVARSSRLHKIECSLNVLVNSAIDIFKSQAREQKIDITFDSINETIIPCDPDAVKQVLINIFKNSLEAIKQNGKISISIAESAENVIMSISDNGPGIADINQALKPFHTTKIHGTGLGLSTASKLIADHDGQLTIESTPDKGTTIKIKLPRREDFN